MSGAVSSRGQITIDREVRKQLGIQTGMMAYQRVVDGLLEVIFLPAPHRRSLRGALYRPGEEPRSLTGDALEQAVILGVAAEEVSED